MYGQSIMLFIDVWQGQPTKTLTATQHKDKPLIQVMFHLG